MGEKAGRRFHDGSAATLKDAVNAHTTSSFTPAEMDFLLSYLEQIDGLESGPLDSDDDNLADELERVLGTDPNNADTDGDTISDYDELNLDEVPGSYTFVKSYPFLKKQIQM